METIHTIDLIIDFVLKISDHVYFWFPSNDIIEYYGTNKNKIIKIDKNINITCPVTKDLLSTISHKIESFKNKTD